MRKLCGHWVLFGIYLNILGQTGAAHAQEATMLGTVVVDATDGESTSNETIVARRDASSTKTETPIVETPQSVDVITRKQLDDQNPQTVGNALQYTAGVFTPDATTRFDGLFIRGFGGFGTSTTFVSFMDGLRLPRGQAFGQFQIDPYLLDRIDVLKGPSAVLYGQVSPGGLVNMVSRDPSASPYNELRFEAGSYGRAQAGLTTQGAFDDKGVWQYSLSAIGRISGTPYDGVSEQRVGVAPAVAWQPDADTRLTLRAFYENDPEGGYFNSIYPTFLSPPKYRSFLNRNFNVGDPTFDSYTREQGGIGYSFEHRFNDFVEIRSSARYTDVSAETRGIQMAGAMTSSGILPRQAVISTEQAGGIATDNNAVFTFATGALSHKIVAGVDYQSFSSDWTYQWGLAPSLNVVFPVYGVTPGPFFTLIDNTQTVEQTGLYLQDQIAVGNWRAVLGVRQDWTSQQTENYLASGAKSDQSASATTYRAALLYLFDNGLAPYASYATSFEPVIGVDAQGQPFIPTEAEQFEVGLKYQPTFMNALFTVSAFDIRQQNVLTPGPVLGFNVQTGEIRSRGLEFEARADLSANLEMIGAMTLLNTEVTASSVASYVGKHPQAVPNYFGSLWLNYKFTDGALAGLTTGAGLRVIGPSYADDANLIKVDGFALIDLSLRYDLAMLSPHMKGATATLDVRNLFDTVYYTSCTYDIYCQYGSARTFLAGLRKTW